MNLEIKNKSGEVHVTIEYPLYGEGTQSAVKFAAPKVLQILEQNNVKVGRLLKNATLNNKREETCRQTWVFEALKPPPAKRRTRAPTSATLAVATPKKPRRRHKTVKTTTEEG